MLAIQAHMRAVEIKCSEYVSNTGTHKSSGNKVQ